MVGQQFGRLTVVEPGETRKSKSGVSRHFWRCRCACGSETFADRQSLRTGNTRSCGCLKSERLVAPRRHGFANSRTYRIWAGMRQRCRSNAFYTDRGISVCERWRDFAAFIDDMGECPSRRHTLDRRDNDRGYEPDNCRWVLHKINCRNKRNNRLLTLDGSTATVAEWSERTGIARQTILSRLRLGWSVDGALSTPTHAFHGPNSGRPS
jgi:hypothetical protein